MDRSYHIGIAARAQHAVHLGQLLPDAVGIPLAEAAGHQQLFQFALPLQLSQLQDMVNGHKTRVVAVVPVLVAYIAEADDHIVDSGLFSLKKLVELHRTTLVKE